MYNILIAIFKAIHPFVTRSVSFQEVSIFPLSNNTATFDLSQVTGCENYSFMGQGYWEQYMDISTK